ncbi:MAG: hypothetical protein ACSHW1_17420 [Yoonia sp.]|uniref:hypothetical protein n=1 Tax=Yoonia sp. TaxID=2212373 RepID=UPI003EF8EC36
MEPLLLLGALVLLGIPIAVIYLLISIAGLKRRVTVGISLSLVALTGILTLYSTISLFHQDVSGGLLTGALAIELGADFDLYNAYFPPIEKYWFMLAAKLATILEINAAKTLVVQTYVAVLISVVLAYAIRQRTVGAGLLFFAIPLVVLLLLPILFKNIFGLREHLVVLGLWPYLVLRAAGDNAAKVGLGLRVFLGFWLGFTLLFKYFYSIVVFLVEATDALVCRRFGLLFRIECIVAGSIVFAYLFVWLGLDPAQREVIRAMQNSISANVLPLTGSIKIAFSYLAFGLPTWLILARLRIAPRLNALGLACLIGTVFVAGLQGRWYTHHLFPIIMAFVGWWWLLGPNLPKWVHVLVAAVLVMPIKDEFFARENYTTKTSDVRAVFTDRGISLAGKRVALLNQHPSPFNEIILDDGGLRWSPQMNIAYVSAELMPFDRPKNRGQTPPPIVFDDSNQNFLHGQLLTLWESEPPDILILDTSFQWPLRYVHFQWEQILSEDKRFQRILAQFEPAFTHKSDSVHFTYYVRKD